LRRDQALEPQKHPSVGLPPAERDGFNRVESKVKNEADEGKGDDGKG